VVPSTPKFLEFLKVFAEKMRRTRQTSLAPSAEEGAVTMAQVLEMMRALQDNVAASRAEQEKMQAELAASQSRNNELNRVNEELRRTLQT